MNEKTEISKVKDKINSLEQKIDKKDQKIRQLENKINRLTEKNQDKLENKNTENKEITRRVFLKKLGLGAAGLGALSLTPGSALNIKDDNLDIYTGTGENDLQKYFSVNTGGPVQITNTDLEIKGSMAATDDDPVTQFSVGTLAEGEALINKGGSLTGRSVGGSEEGDVLFQETESIELVMQWKNIIEANTSGFTEEEKESMRDSPECVALLKNSSLSVTGVP